uniref:Pantothenate synthetase n=1 Tax=Desulfatirhabdium butyrativorans TaxID=340467 RepID=A0A7C4W0A7_9BACT
MQGAKIVCTPSRGNETIETITDKRTMQALCSNHRSEGKTIGLVPTMGYLHEGHLSLMRLARKSADILVTSIFVNPTQFGPNEDLAAYPRDLDRDRHLCESVGVDYVFAPSADNLYGPNYETYVELERLPNHLCGLSRPGHFRGVATVVTKLFHITKPHFAVFGQKDYQQVLVIRKMAADLDLDVDIVTAPTVRETDGLAMSSRNTYLKPHQRESALSLSRSLKHLQEMLDQGIHDSRRLIDAAAAYIASFPETRIDYVAICHPETLEPVDTIEDRALLALAVRVGTTRLIDNTILRRT